MIALAARELHQFRAASQRFIYLDRADLQRAASAAVLDHVIDGPTEREEIVAAVAAVRAGDCAECD